MTSSRRGLAAGLSAATLTTLLAGSVPAMGVGNGSAVAEGTYGFVAHIAVGQAGAGAACTGALIDPQWVITAAACFGSGAPDATITIGGQVRESARLVKHPDRNVVLVKLDKPTTIAPVAIGTTAPAVGDVLRIAGYGRTATTWIPGALHAAQFQVTGVGTGLLDVAGVSGTQPSVCKGDAGGPALRESGGTVELVALNHTSAQGGCLGQTETARTAVETRVDDLAAWIRTYAPGGLAEDHRDDVTMVYSYASGALGPFTFTTAANGAMSAKGGCNTAAGLYTTSVKIFRGDFNGDDIVDQVVLHNSANNTLSFTTFLTRPDGTCSAGVQSWTSSTFGSYSRMLMTSGDYNGDGRDDIAGFYNYADYGIGLFTWLSSPTGTFSASSRPWYNAPSPYWGEIGRMKVFSGDFNGDGLDDIGSFYGYADYSVGIYSWIAKPGGGFNEDQRAWYVPAEPYWGDPKRLRIAAGDFNGDGRGDVAGLYNYANGNLAVLTWTAKADGTFNNAFSSWKSTSAVWGSWDTTRLTSGDFNGDGRDDLSALFGATDGSLSLNTLVAAENGGFAAPVKAWGSTTFGSYGSINLPEDPV
ncbi:trypsin-like serine protease [Actinoplanes sichuanensis]|uniref:Trypsin-like serine protease n=1 Tax=Actinoplanes sichuanensis TaxID=512349 RepID=A0ABW4A970_9ACTN|nr:trypsin-like serine protease [Actinoplanes sichuanensis]